MLTGSVAMSFYGQPRMTRDIDIVVEVDAESAERLAGAFEGDYYAPVQAMKEAVATGGMFNLIHMNTLTKVDMIVRKEAEYRRHEFARRRRMPLHDGEVFVVSKEDLILSKLWWAKDSRSEMQRRDVENLASTGFDEAYMKKWLKELGLDDLADAWLS